MECEESAVVFRFGIVDGACGGRDDDDQVSIRLIDTVEGSVWLVLDIVR